MMSLQGRAAMVNNQKKNDRRKSPKNQIDLGEKRSGSDRRKEDDFREQVEAHFNFYRGFFNKEVVEEIFVEELLPELSMLGIMDAKSIDSIQDELQFQRSNQVKTLNRLAYKVYEYSFWHAKIDSDNYGLKGSIVKLAKQDVSKLLLKSQQQFAKWMIKQRKWDLSQKEVIEDFSRVA